jgi:hypothetical protein
VVGEGEHLDPDRSGGCDKLERLEDAVRSPAVSVQVDA